jgi:hypothetical protein
LLIAPIIFLSSCKTTLYKASPEFAAAVDEWEAAMTALIPPVPVPPEMEPVQFEDKDGGLWLSHNDYRALERNIIAMREYARRLEIVLWFYRGE